MSEFRRMARRMAWLLMGVWVGAAPSVQAADSVPFAANLTNIPADLAVMQAERIPMLLFVHASYCGYCQMVDEEFIRPLEKDPAYRGKLLIRRIEIDGATDLIDRQGQRESPTRFANRLGVRLVPVVMFFDPAGRSVGEALRGVTVPDFYPFYLQQGIDLAETCSRQPDPARCTPKKPADQRSL
ncbi:thioredoxin family protein [Halothiobacillus sp. DCM-1]|uniref:thioredoxin family protein n=1 Tax=Halothiobacillus sp. DCM-1 TaxID=3112558 RepID=UPI003251A567